ncbi:MAG: FAD-dependent oxidoreductase [Proteobacteria bacterium]|nr:FAD-dependent oxidoreductase [Pseudomonadota bacterium]
MAKEKTGSVLIIGAGIGGIRAAFDLAESGFKVYLTDRSAALGGTLSQLDYQFPTNHCGMCKMLPIFSRDDSSQFCLRRDLFHRNIELLPYTELEKVEGEAGNFDISLIRKSRWLDEEKCIDCGKCVEVCPVEVRDEFNEGLSRRKAIYQKLPLSIPNVYTIDREHCTLCGKCVEICPTKAIQLSQGDEKKTIHAGAIILSAGFEEFNPKQLTQYGHGRFGNVVTSIEFERLFSQTGPTLGKIFRPSDQRIPRKVAFLQCAGSREKERDYCSFACCMYAIKEAMVLKSLDPGAEVKIFYMDIRAFGKDFYRYFLRARDESGIKFIRTRVPVIKEDPGNRNLRVSYLGEDGKVVKEEFDLIVLSVGQMSPPGAQELSKRVGIELNEWGFCSTEPFSQVKTGKEGVLVGGSFSGLKDISETLVQSSAAALRASELISARRYQLTKRSAPFLQEERAEEDQRIAVFLCLCGSEIESALDLSAMERFLHRDQTVDEVVKVRYLCTPDGMSQFKEALKNTKANRILIGACLPYGLERKFKDALIEAGFHPSLSEICDVRGLINIQAKEEREAKAERLLSCSMDRLKKQEPLPVTSHSLHKRALVIGGGIAGLTAASAIASQGFEVCLVEKSSQLGGNLNRVHFTLEGNDPQTLLKTKIQEVEAHPLITVYRSATLMESKGYVGNFISRLKTDAGEEVTLDHGVTIIATGGEEARPDEYLLGNDTRVITLRELEEAIFSQDERLNRAKNIVMIQCAGGRDEKKPYCSRVCCSQSVKCAIRLKEKRPDLNISILYRDMMTYGFKEAYFTKARELGIVFIRYDLNQKPEIKKGSDAHIQIELIDPSMGEKYLLPADLLALAVPVIPSQDNKKMAEICNLPLDEDGFFNEADIKWRPVDFLTDGIFLCGLAHSPRFIDEAISQAEAAAQRAIGILSKEQIESGRIVSEVNERRCSLCEVCIAACPYQARIKDEENRKVVVREPICQGCGVCAMVCPNKASKLRGYKDRQMLSLVDTMVLGG